MERPVKVNDISKNIWTIEYNEIYIHKGYSGPFVSVMTKERLGDATEEKRKMVTQDCKTCGKEGTRKFATLFLAAHFLEYEMKNYGSFANRINKRILRNNVPGNTIKLPGDYVVWTTEAVMYGYDEIDLESCKGIIGQTKEIGESFLHLLEVWWHVTPALFLEYYEGCDVTLEEAMKEELGEKYF